MKRRLAIFRLLLLAALCAPHGAHGAHRAVETVICGGGGAVILWLPTGAHEAHGHGVDCCLIHAALPPPTGAASPGLSRARLRRRPAAPRPHGAGAPLRRARGPPRIS